MKNKKTALLAGATGLVGGHLLNALLASEHYEKVIVLARRPLEAKHPKLETVLFDYDQPDAAKVKADDVFCCLGTTLKKAGSKAAQYKIDHDYPLEIGKMAKQNGAKQYILVSSIGADAGSSNFYLNTKGTLEQNLQSLGFETFITLRPSFLLGDRSEFRLGEKIGIVLAKITAPLMVGGLRKYRGVEASAVAGAMVHLANQGLKGFVAVDSDKINDQN